MDESQTSPISQLLNSLGLTREDLMKRSDQMRQFLTADSERVFDESRSTSPTDLRSSVKPASLGASFARPLSLAGSGFIQDASPQPMTPVKTEPSDHALPQRTMDTMEAVIERQRLARKEKRGRRDKDREASVRGPVSHRSPTPSASASYALDLDFFTRDQEPAPIFSTSVTQAAPQVSCR